MKTRYKIVNYTLVTLSIIVFFFGELLIHFSKNMDIDRTTFETVFMPLMAISKLSLPFFIIGLFALNVKNGSYVVGMLFLVIGMSVVISGYASYETWFILLEENAKDPRFQNNFSKQLDYHRFSMLEGALILGSGIYLFVRKYLKQCTSQYPNL